MNPFDSLPILPGDFLLPSEDVHLPLWAVLACDQFTAQPAYWQSVAQAVGDAPSALRLILPEAYLADEETRLPAIWRTMDAYQTDGTLVPAVRRGFILVERSTGEGARVGLMTLCDLEQYDCAPDSRSPLRPTEGTVADRLPARAAIRAGASLELSHVLALIDDPMMSVAEPLYQRRDTLQKLYDFPLMAGGGHLVGWAVTDEDDVSAVARALLDLRAQLQGENAPLIAIGDGNHSLAAAKLHWERVKATLPPAEWARHPARYSSMELTNLRDPAIRFEPIHRVLFGADGEDVLSALTAWLAARGISIGGDAQEFHMVWEGKEILLSLSPSPYVLTVGTVQAFLDEWCENHPEARVDYIHGEEAARLLAAGQDAVAFLLRAFPKDALFEAVTRNGALPRKTFSMGEAREKRYYMEARRIRP